MTHPDRKTATKAYSLYPHHIDTVKRLAAREFRHRESAALQAIIDFYEAATGQEAQP